MQADYYLSLPAQVQFLSEGFGPSNADAIKILDDYENLPSDPDFEQLIEELTSASRKSSRIGGCKGSHIG